MAYKPKMLASKSIWCTPTDFYEKIGSNKILERQKYHTSEKIWNYDTLV